MSLIDRINKAAEQRAFWKCVTNACAEEYSKVNAEYMGILSDLEHDGWHLTNDKSMLFKINTNAYLIRTKEGFDIDKTTNQDLGALSIENEFLTREKFLLGMLNKYINYKDEFKNSRAWKIQANIDRDDFIALGCKLGYIKNINELELEENTNSKTK